MKKQIISIALTGLLMASMTMTAFAADTAFQDVPVNAWYAQDLAQVQGLGIITGKGNNSFDPNGSLTIAEAVTMAAKTRAQYSGEELPSIEGKWYAGAVAYAKENGIITGAEFSSYEAKATRAEMAYLFACALPTSEYQAINSISKLPDVSGSTKYSADIFKLYNAGILAGADKYGTFNPNRDISRAETAVILNRVIFTDNRKMLALEDKPVVDQNQSGSITITEGQQSVRRLAKAGDIFVKADGTKVTIKVGPNGFVAEGQNIAPDIGAMNVEGGYPIFDGMRVTSQQFNGERPSQKYIVNKYNGQGMWSSDWAYLVDHATFPTQQGKEGQVTADGLFVWTDGGWGCAIDW